MLQRLVIWTMLVTIWRRYGKALRLLPLVIVLLFLISMLHSDYVQYVRVSEDRKYLPWSFIIKWLLIISVIAVYWRFVLLVIRGGPKDPLSLKKREGKKAYQNDSDLDAQRNDPFKNIREKKQLRSKADLLIQKKKND